MIDFDDCEIEQLTKRKCFYCDKEFDFFSRPLEFTWFTQTPYITCPYCNKKLYPDLD